MASVTPEETNFMKSLMEDINSIDQPKAVVKESTQEKRFTADKVSVTNPGVDLAVKADFVNILSVFNDLTDNKIHLNEFTENTARKLDESMELFPEVREAVRTQRQGDKLVIGEWEVISESKNGKSERFRIIHNKTDETIAKDLFLKESAQAIVKMLNRGITINDPKFFQLLEADRKYSSSLIDMSTFKKAKSRYLNESKDRQADTAEARYQFARDKAVESKLLIQKILKSL